ncbi:MAG: hypothetical protein NT087_00920 [Deltaproteobacteria bacterium]|nr:hypothetical protein [Deltaproteobacteria bacterium]
MKKDAYAPVTLNCKATFFMLIFLFSAASTQLSAVRRALKKKKSTRTKNIFLLDLSQRPEG